MPRIGSPPLPPPSASAEAAPLRSPPAQVAVPALPPRCAADTRPLRRNASPPATEDDPRRRMQEMACQFMQNTLRTAVEETQKQMQSVLEPKVDEDDAEQE